MKIAIAFRFWDQNGVKKYRRVIVESHQVAAAQLGIRERYTIIDMSVFPL